MAEKMCQNSIQCELSTNPVLTSHFKFSVASCATTTVCFITKHIWLLEHSVRVLLTNCQASSSILKYIFGHFYPQEIFQNFDTILSLLQDILGKCSFISSSNNNHMQMQ